MMYDSQYKYLLFAVLGLFLLLTSVIHSGFAGSRFDGPVFNPLHQDSGPSGFQDTYETGELFVHDLVTYTAHPLWQYEWERNLLKGNGLYYSAGSVTTDKLYLNGQLFLNEKLGSGWSFISRGRWYESRHQNEKTKTAYLGFEKQIVKKLSLFFMFFPASDKEFSDMQLGFSVSNERRDNYLNLAMIVEDMAYDGKNDLGGTSSKKPLGIQWYARYELEKFSIYSEGRYNQGFERNYPDIENSPLLTYHQNRKNYTNTHFYYKLTKTSLLQGGLYYYFFNDAKHYYAFQNNYNFSNDIYDFSIQYLFQLKKKHRFRVLTHYVKQKSKGTGYQEHNYRRNEILPALYYEYMFSGHVITPGYIFSLHNWDYSGSPSHPDYSNNNGFYDKIYLGYYYTFKKRGRLHLSVSHQLKTKGFGGGNIQFILFF